MECSSLTNVYIKQSLHRNPSSLTTPRLIRYYEESGPLTHSGNVLRFLQTQTIALTWKFNQDCDTTNFDK